MLQSFRGNRGVDAAFYGIRPASTALIAAAGYTIIKISLFDAAAFAAGGDLLSLFRFKAMALAALVLIFSNIVPYAKKLHPVVFILVSAVVGVVFRF